MLIRKNKLISGSNRGIFRRFRVYIIAVVLGAIAAGVALVLFALLVFLFGISVADSGFLSLIAFGFGCLVSGFTAGAMKHRHGLAAGITAAALFALPIVLVGFVLNGITAIEAVEAGTAVAAGSGTFNKVIIAAMCGAVGGVLGVNRNGGF